MELKSLQFYRPIFFTKNINRFCAKLQIVISRRDDVGKQTSGH